MQVCSSNQPTVFHRRIDVSAPQETNLASYAAARGEEATQVTASGWASRVRTIVNEKAFQIWICPLAKPHISHVPQEVYSKLFGLEHCINDRMRLGALLVQPLE
jgi:hypothetical protein